MSARIAITGRQRPVWTVLSWVGLCLSLVSLTAALPSLFQRAGGVWPVLTNAVGYFWTLVLLALGATAVRTTGPRASAGAWLSGFFGTTALAALAGRPVVAHFGVESWFAVAVWAPFTEEVVKLAPVALFLLLAMRGRSGWPARPAVADAVMLGTAVGAGFAVYENALYARTAGGAWFGHPPLSLLAPSLTTVSADGHTMLVGGHLVYTGLTSLGLATTLCYRRYWRGAWLAAPVAFAVAIAEHATVNQLSLASGGSVPWWARITATATVHGYLSTLLLVGGVAAMTAVEWRLLRARIPRRHTGGRHGPARLWPFVHVPGAEIAVRAAALAASPAARPVAKQVSG